MRGGQRADPIPDAGVHTVPAGGAQDQPEAQEHAGGGAAPQAEGQAQVIPAGRAAQGAGGLEDGDVGLLHGLLPRAPVPKHPLGPDQAAAVLPRRADQVGLDPVRAPPDRQQGDRGAGEAAAGAAGGHERPELGHRQHVHGRAAALQGDDGVQGQVLFELPRGARTADDAHAGAEAVHSRLPGPERLEGRLEGADRHHLPADHQGLRAVRGGQRVRRAQHRGCARWVIGCLVYFLVYFFVYFLVYF